MRGIVIGTMVILLALAPPAAARPARDFDGHWSGLWQGGATHDTWKPDFTLEDDGHGHVNGEIHWTLVTAGQPNEQGQEGPAGIEYVVGHVDGGELILDGVRTDNPKNILGQDHYRLVLSDDGSVLGGISSNGGTWSGALRAQRAR
ncbi:MAG: hypothetical protein ISS15_09835 [Alphaproteobacteria bacterium]|nr:hypothetical protein [Alphaproteobacteria bacterium]MBL6938695.1 hypothetical protein [Alphaproteobacteria bacterium]MBL7097948.1 hypothetical protein [Alphaproteobacteria bacterium]